MNAADQRRTGVHYAWIVAFLTFLTMLAAAGARSAPGVLMVPLEEEFGWSRATISSAVSVNLVLYGLAGPFAAALLEWLGVRRTMVLSLALTAIGVALTTLMSKPWQLVLLWGVVVGSGTGMTALVLGATVASRWFDKSRGLVMGMLSASTATGQLVFLPLLAWLVATHGWRAAAFYIVAAGLVVVPLVGFLMRDRPADIGLLPYGATQAPPPPAPRRNPVATALVTLWEAMGHRDFWLLAGGFFVCGLTTNGLIGTHLVPACFDHGIPEVKAAGLLAMMGIFDFIGTTGSGWLSDRVDNRVLLFWYYALRGLSLIFLPFSFDLSFYGLSLFAVFYGLDWIATVPPTVRLTADCFGPQKAGIVFGWIFAAHQLGAAVAASAAGIIRTELGDYLLAFVVAGAIGIVAGVMSLFIGRKPTAARPAEAVA